MDVDEKSTVKNQIGGDMVTNTQLLLKKIEESGLKKRFIAEKVGITSAQLAKKIFGKSQFKAEEIKNMCDVLHIVSLDEREQIFFAQDVE